MTDIDGRNEIIDWELTELYVDDWNKEIFVELWADKEKEMPHKLVLYNFAYTIKDLRNEQFRQIYGKWKCRDATTSWLVGNGDK